MDGIVKTFEINKLNCNLKTIKAIIIISIFKTLDTIDEFYITNRIGASDITIKIQDNNTAKIYKRHFKSFLLNFKDTL